MKRETIVNGVKMIGGTGASICAGFVVSKVLDGFLPFNASPLKKIGYSIGVSVLSGMIGAQASSYVEDSIDEIDELVSKFENDEEYWSKAKVITIN